MCISCVEHTIHLAAKAFIDALHPKWKKRALRSALGDALDEDEDNDKDGDEDGCGDEDGWVVDYVDAIRRPAEKEPVATPVSSDQMELEPEQFEPGDTLGKLLALITQVSFRNDYPTHNHNTPCRFAHRLKRRHTLRLSARKKASSLCN